MFFDKGFYVAKLLSGWMESQSKKVWMVI